MHELGVAHGDLEARNVMIDRKTGLPRVIDFGRSKNIGKKESEFHKIIEEDFANIDEIQTRFENFLNKF